ncbi:MAG: hypothetical protein AB8H86_03015 [Polyangiales bacterium]
MYRKTILAAILALSSLAGAEARADYHPSRPSGGGITALELTLGVGVMGHTTARPPIEGYGYDRDPGPAADVALRLLFGRNQYFRHGVTMRGVYFAGRQFGANGHGFRFGLADLTYTVRTLLPCMSSQDGVRFYAAASLGITGGWVDAGSGRGPMNADYLVRQDAAANLDHATLGWTAGATGEMHYGKLLVGVSIDLRRLWGIDTDVGSSWVRSMSLRVGYRFDATDSQEAS